MSLTTNREKIHVGVVGQEGTVPIALDIYYTPLVSYLFLSSRGLYSVWGVLDSWGGKSLQRCLFYLGGRGLQYRPAWLDFGLGAGENSRQPKKKKLRWMGASPSGIHRTPSSLSSDLVPLVIKNEMGLGGSLRTTSLTIPALSCFLGGIQTQPPPPFTSSAGR